MDRRRQKRLDQERDATSINRHSETTGIGRKTLFWTWWAAGAAIVGALAALIADMPSSKPPPATASQASPAPSPQAVLTVVPSPVPTAAESPLESPQASPTQCVADIPL